MRKKSQRQNKGENAQILGLSLEERNEHVACHASALALGMTNEVCREVETYA